MARVALVPRAAKQAKAIETWWRENRPASPDLFSSELAAAIDLLAIAPEAGQRVENLGTPGIRRVLLRTTQFHVYYDFDGKAARIVAIWSGLRGRGPDLA